MITTAIILAGGFGTRLQSIISDLPKPMAPVNGEPFLNYQLRYLKHYGIKNVIFSTGYMAQAIRSYYGNEWEGLAILYSHEENPLGTGGGIRLALEKSNEETNLVLNGDSFFDVNIFHFFRVHGADTSRSSLALRRIQNAARYGTIELNQDNEIVSFHEKHGIEKEGLINGGIYLLEKTFFIENTPAGKNFSIEKDFFEKHAGKKELKGYESEGYFIDIGIPDDFKKAQDDFKGFKYN